MLRYYNICNNPEELTDEEWALKYNILKTLINEDIRLFKEFNF